MEIKVITPGEMNRRIKAKEESIQAGGPVKLISGETVTRAEYNSMTGWKMLDRNIGIFNPGKPTGKELKDYPVL